MISSEIHARVMQISFGGDAGTGFLHNRRRRQYLITARHLGASFCPTQGLSILHARVWKPIACRLIGHAEGEPDVSVFAVPAPIMASEAAPPSDQPPNLSYGMDAYFLGFPFGLYGDHGAMVRDYPMPFVKRAIAASLTDRHGLFHLDGINNEGFSGGPVVVRHHESNHHAVVGVVSGYTANASSVLQGEHDTGLIVQENSGLIRAFHIAVANHIIDNNPTGTPLPEAPRP